MAASKLFVFSILALTFSFAKVSQLWIECGSSPETSDSAVIGEFELLKSRITFLESNIEERNREFMKKEETILQMQKIIQEKAYIIASLQSDIESLKLCYVNNEQGTRIREAECVLQKELMNPKVETALISRGLTTVHEGRLPHWLSVHLVHFQLYMVSYWNEHGKPAMLLSIQKALEAKSHAEDWIKLQIQMIETEAKTLNMSYMHQIVMQTRSLLDKVYVVLKPYAVELLHGCRKLITSSSFYHHQVQEMLKNHELIRPLADMELAWFVASALLAMPCLFLFLLCSSIFRKRVSKRNHSSITNHTRRRLKRAHFDKRSKSD